MAAGVTVSLSKLGAFQDFVAERISGDVGRASAAARDLKIDAAATAAGATVETINEIERAGPFGSDNPAPVFAFPRHRVSYAEIVGSGHVRASIAADGGIQLKAMAFRAADTPLGQRLLARDGDPLHVAGILSVDHWQGRERPSLKIIDIAEPSPPR